MLFRPFGEKVSTVVKNLCFEHDETFPIIFIHCVETLQGINSSKCKKRNQNDAQHQFAGKSSKIIPPRMMVLIYHILF